MILRPDTAQDWGQTSSGIWVPDGRERQLQAVDLFCGCGGFSVGFEAAGIDVVGAVEWDASAAISYLWNLGSPRGCAVGYTDEDARRRLAKALEKSRSHAEKARKGGAVNRTVEPGEDGWIGAARPYPRPDMGCRGMVFGDAAATTGEHILEVMRAGGWRGEVDVVIGGPPCQGISRSGRQRVNDPRNNLVLEFVRLADELGCEVFVMENVPPLITEKKYRPLFMAIVERAHAAGFDVVANVIDACNYGVPQRRRRAIIQGTRGRVRRVPQLPMPTHWGIVARRGEDFSEVLDPEDDSDATPATKSKQPTLFELFGEEAS